MPEKKTMQEELLAALNISMKEGELSEDIETMADLRGANVTVQQAMVFAQVRKALDGDTRAFVAIMDALDKVPASAKRGLKVTAFDEIAKQYKQGATRQTGA